MGKKGLRVNGVEEKVLIVGGFFVKEVGIDFGWNLVGWIRRSLLVIYNSGEEVDVVLDGDNEKGYILERL
ncbi:hypothetical protein ACRFB9_28475 [Klebsiella pneumoniae]